MVVEEVAKIKRILEENEAQIKARSSTNPEGGPREGGALMIKVPTIDKELNKVLRSVQREVEKEYSRLSRMGVDKGLEKLRRNIEGRGDAEEVNNEEGKKPAEASGEAVGGEDGVDDVESMLRRVLEYVDKRGGKLRIIVEVHLGSEPKEENS